MDTTLIRLLDGSRAYLHAVIDNFSRRILAWKVTPSFEPSATAEILLTASKSVDYGVPTVLADGGENWRGKVQNVVTGSSEDCNRVTSNLARRIDNGSCARSVHSKYPLQSRALWRGCRSVTTPPPPRLR